MRPVSWSGKAMSFSVSVILEKMGKTLSMTTGEPEDRSEARANDNSFFLSGWVTHCILSNQTSNIRPERKKKRRLKNWHKPWCHSHKASLRIRVPCWQLTHTHSSCIALHCQVTNQSAIRFTTHHFELIWYTTSWAMQVQAGVLQWNLRTYNSHVVFADFLSQLGGKLIENVGLTQQQPRCNW